MNNTDPSRNDWIFASFRDPQLISSKSFVELLYAAIVLDKFESVRVHDLEAVPADLSIHSTDYLASKIFTKLEFIDYLRQVVQIVNAAIYMYASLEAAEESRTVQTQTEMIKHSAATIYIDDNSFYYLWCRTWLFNADILSHYEEFTIHRGQLEAIVRCCSGTGSR